MEWVLVVILAIIVVSIWSLLDPDDQRARRFKTELAKRTPIDDTDLFRRYFDSDMESGIPGYVRQSLADEMGYPAEKILPDDDLMFFWREADLVDVFRDWESKFRIAITQADVESDVECTVRSFAEMVNRLRRAT